MKLTAKRERFAQMVAEGMTQSDAYRECFSTKRMKPETIWEEASRLAKNPEVSARVKAIQAEINAKTVEKTAITREDLIAELEEARTAAMQGDRPQAGAAVAATVAKGKLLGLQVDKVEHSGMLAHMDVAAGLTDAQKTQASIAILRQSMNNTVVAGFAKDVLRAHGYEFED